MKKMNIKWIAGFVLIIAVFALIGGSWSSAFARDEIGLECVDTFAGGPDFLFNAKPETLKMAYGVRCLGGVLVDNGPTFLVNMLNSRSVEDLVECPLVQSGAPAFLVNAQPNNHHSVAEIAGKCSPG